MNTLTNTKALFKDIDRIIMLTDIYYYISLSDFNNIRGLKLYQPQAPRIIRELYNDFFSALIANHQICPLKRFRPEIENTALLSLEYNQYLKRRFFQLDTDGVYTKILTDVIVCRYHRYEEHSISNFDSEFEMPF